MFKMKCFSFLMTLVLLLVSISLSTIGADTSGQDEFYLLGDLNNDNVVDSLDCTILQRHILGNDILDSSTLRAADINGDGVVNSIDYNLLSRHVLGQYYENDIIIEVVDSETGVGIEGAYLSFSVDGYEGITIVYETDENGFFRLENVQLNVATRARINVMSEGYITEEIIIYAHSISGTEPLTFTAEEAIKLYQEQIIQLEDINFENYVRSVIDKPSGAIYLSDVKDIERLAPYYMNIESLEGIQHFHNLKSLSLCNDVFFPGGSMSYTDINQIRDLSPIAGLTKLETLGFTGNEVEDISPLAELKNLRSLRISDNSLIDISVLSKLQNLEILYAYSCQLDDLSPLAELVNLRRLILGYNLIEDISPLSELIKLERLSLENNQIKDITPLSQLLELEHLSLRNNLIEDFSPVENLPKLNTFWK
ncbi:leucine-rich repeat domain-containing protein [Natronospora cellulosivora (SeqCode)]